MDSGLMRLKSRDLIGCSSGDFKSALKDVETPGSSLCKYLQPLLNEHVYLNHHHFLRLALTSNTILINNSVCLFFCVHCIGILLQTALYYFLNRCDALLNKQHHENTVEPICFIVCQWKLTSSLSLSWHHFLKRHPFH